MLNSVRKITPIALAFVLVLAGAVFAGDNAGVTFSTTSDTEVSGVGAGGTISLDVTASGMVGVKQYDITVAVSPADAFDLSATGFTAATGFIAPGQEVGDGTVKVGAANFGGQIDGDGSLGTFVLTASSSFNADTAATVTVSAVSLGPSSTDRDAFDAAAVAISVSVNPPPPPVTEPTFSANTATDVSLDFSGIGDGDAADGSDGEVTFGVSFTDGTGGAGSGQSITWSVSNNGSESVFLLGDSVQEIAAGADVDVTSTTDADGNATATFDSEGDKSAGSTSISVTASTSADNSEGESRNLSVEFSATWDVPVPAEVASFAGEVTPDREVLLLWGVASQTNNLGWEVLRSTDESVYERIGRLVEGEGTTDDFRTYEFVDIAPPAADVVFYYLRQIDLDGAATRSQVVEVFLAGIGLEAQLVPTTNELAQNFPNPFNPETTISFDLASSASVSLTVFDATGQVIRTLVNGQAMSAGSYRHVWDGRNHAGHSVGSGIYFYELKAGEFASMKKMTLLQ